MRAITFLIEYAKTPDQLGLVLKVLTSELVDKNVPAYSEKGGHFSVVLEQILSRNIQKYTQSNEETLDLSQMWTNLLTLLEWEKSDKISLLNCRFVSRALEENFINLTSVFSSEVHHVHIIADILDKTGIPMLSSSYSPPIRVILNLTQSAVNYFFACCRAEGMSKFLCIQFQLVWLIFRHFDEIKRLSKSLQYPKTTVHLLESCQSFGASRIA